MKNLVHCFSRTVVSGFLDSLDEKLPLTYRCFYDAALIRGAVARSYHDRFLHDR
jgi:hypothetical protein